MSIKNKISALVLLVLLTMIILSCGGESTVIYMAPTVQISKNLKHQFDLKQLRAREKEALTSYKLLDSGKGIYQIPIDSAMKILTSIRVSK